MELAVLGDPEEGPTLRLDHERFAYAGKFVMSSTGKAVARDDGDVVAAVAFNRDRTDDAWWLRYVTVRNDRHQEGVGPELLAFTAEHLENEGAATVRIAVNNPFAYEACYKVGFGYTGRETGLAEVVLERPLPRDPEAYRAGLTALKGDHRTPVERAFIEGRIDAGPPGLRDS